MSNLPNLIETTWIDSEGFEHVKGLDELVFELIEKHNELIGYLKEKPDVQ